MTTKKATQYHIGFYEILITKPHGGLKVRFFFEITPNYKESSILLPSSSKPTIWYSLLSGLS